jgi:hypothetical protein
MADREIADFVERIKKLRTFPLVRIMRFVKRVDNFPGFTAQVLVFREVGTAHTDVAIKAARTQNEIQRNGQVGEENERDDPSNRPLRSPCIEKSGEGQQETAEVQD